MIVTRTPLRISFFGGGTDLAAFYQSHDHGAVLSTTIDKFVYVTVKRHGALFDEPYRLNYSKTEMVQAIDEIENEIGRESLRLLNLKPPIHIATIADIPSGSGLGSSSAYAVGLLNALCGLERRRTTFGDLAAMACHIEVDVLAKPVGKQDQYSAAAGGFNHITFRSDGSTSITPINADAADIHELFDSFQLFWTGVTRSADTILAEQKGNISRTQDFLVEMRDMAAHAAQRIQTGAMSVPEFGKLLNNAWGLKKRLATSISNPHIDSWYARARAAGAYGGKLCGAGGGGFLLFCTPRQAHEAVRNALSDLKEVPFGFEPAGSTILFSGVPHAGHASLRSILRERHLETANGKSYT
jgi:D-glycero-alpha-D-manno-heptose-7-phosphate kinase